MPTTLYSILDEFRQAASSNRDMGDKFERLVAAYLKADPVYSEQFSDVWLWNEWPQKGKKPDTGIDLVAKERATGEYCAIQCKFFDPTSTLDKADIDSFFTTSGKEPFTSRLIVSTTDKWTLHAEEALENQKTPVTRLRIQDLANSPIDWSRFSLNRPQAITLREKKKLRPDQTEALDKVMAGLKKADRGKLIMACGTGKTFTALKIAERMAGPGGTVLFLVPSISLLSQTLREWTAETETPLHCFAVCSDTKVGKKDENEDIRVHDLALPATTDARKLAHQIKALSSKKQMTVVFGTYQSIKVVSEAQKHGAPDFDLVVCDEAHRTTGVSLAEDVAKGDESHFVKVHDAKFLKSAKRLYMTATPRLYSDDSKTKAKEADAVLCSMDDESLYGQELYRLDFSEAVRKGLLSDYKVMVLAVDEKYVNNSLQSMLADKNSELNLEDAVKITGCWNGLSKRLIQSPEGDSYTDPGHMRRAVAFSHSIKASKKITELFSKIVDQYKQQGQDGDHLDCEVHHVDGTFNALLRNRELDWLKEDTTNQGNVCRILSNARCLAEGVDVPALDAVMFLNPRNSVVDVVQSVGRVMRKAEGKKYGYIILPIGVPADVPPEEALSDNKKYKVVWQVLQALRAHDNRFNATINQIDLNKSKPDNIQVIGVTGSDGTERREGVSEAAAPYGQAAFNFPNIEQWRNAIYAKIVLKCGDRRYWESWAKDVAEIAERHRTRIEGLLKGAKPKHKAAFDEFLEGLQDNLNPSIDQDAAIEMLSQHLITKPVFDALFENYKFTQQNPVSIAMQKMLELLEGESLEKETAKLEKFYASVKERASGIDNAAGKQKIVIELYDKFFRTAFPKMAERLGIVYTPIEVVDFIVKSAEHALRQEFGVGLTEKDVHILDPFTGTGTFIVRLLQNGLIQPQDLQRKFREEFHANEIILLAYYIAAINIEEAYHGLKGGEYESFQGIVLTDTFQTAEGKGSTVEAFPENNARLARQRKSDIRVIVSNPPYSAGQSSQNDSNQNLKYLFLDEKIRITYAANSEAESVRNLYDSYIRAFRWASDRIGDRGVICFVTNGSFIDGNNMDGFRKCLTDEFTSIYCFNLRGNQRTQGELSRREGGKIFGSGSRAGITITLLVKNPQKKPPCQLYYRDIGDYLSREEKLKMLNDLQSVKDVTWVKLTPNDSNDWINQRNPEFENFVPMGDKENERAKKFFYNYSLGVATARDVWTWNFSKKNLSLNMKRMIDFYNDQVNTYKKLKTSKEVEDFINNDPKNISWSRGLKTDLGRHKNFEFSKDSVVKGSYRPFCKSWIYFSRNFNDMVYQIPRFFPGEEVKNKIICITGRGSTKEWSPLITDQLPDLEFISKGQCFPQFTYEVAANSNKLSLPGIGGDENGFIVKENLTDEILRDFRGFYDPEISKEDIFYYVYGILHSSEYKSRFSSDLTKMIPRIPFAEDFWTFSKAGRELAKWHLGYETVKPYSLQELTSDGKLDSKKHLLVSEMRFGKNGKAEDRTTIVYNSNVTLKGVPLEAYDYVVNGRPALEWIMERYCVKTEKDSLITNDPNDWSDDPRYILDLVKRVVTVSLETMKIVDSLPPLNEKK